jgi:cbb3-type cytochrome oxidase maturation protein
MSALFVVLPLALLISFGAVVAFIGAVKHGEFDDLDTPARRMLLDDERANATDDRKAGDAWRP